MANILKVTTPLNGFDRPGQAGSGSASSIGQLPGTAIPERLSQTGNAQESRNSTDDSSKNLLSNSNFDGFIRLLKSTPQISSLLPQLVFNDMTALTEAGISAQTAQDILQFFQLIRIEEQDFPAFFRQQLDNTQLFQGTFFSELRKVFFAAPTVEMRSSILHFLKKFTDYSSGQHLFSGIRQTLDQMKPYMFPKAAGELELLTEHLTDAPNGAVLQNSMILKEEIIPFLGAYIARTKNDGTLRNLISLLVLHTSRYENGDVDALMQSFRSLTRFPSFARAFSEQDLLQLLENTSETSGRQDISQTWENHFIRILDSALHGEAGLDNRQLFEAITNSILLNESVYMPLIHLVFPVELDGRSMFSELWIDPDDGGSGENASEPGIRMLLHLNVKDVGTLDLVVLYRSFSASIQLFLPEELSAHEKTIRGGITEILSRNRISCRSMDCFSSVSNVPVAAVFPKIAERSHFVNVTI